MVCNDSPENLDIWVAAEVPTGAEAERTLQLIGSEDTRFLFLQWSLAPTHLGSNESAVILWRGYFEQIYFCVQRRSDPQVWVIPVQYGKTIISDDTFLGVDRNVKVENLKRDDSPSNRSRCVFLTWFAFSFLGIGLFLLFLEFFWILPAGHIPNT